MSTVRSTSSGRSLTCWSPRGRTLWRLTGSSSGPSARPRYSRSESSPTERRPIRWCWRSCSQRRGTAPSGTPTTGSRLTMAVSRRGCDRCEDSSRTACQGHHRRAWLRPGPPARPLRAGHRGAGGSARGDRLRRARTSPSSLAAGPAAAMADLVRAQSQISACWLGQSNTTGMHPVV